MGIRLGPVLALSLMVSNTGCGPCGNGTLIRGTVGGEEVTWCGAHYGIMLDLGSHHAQANNAPVGHSLTLILTQGDEPCDTLSESDLPSQAIYTLFSIPETPGPVVETGFAVDLAGERVLDVKMDLYFRLATITNLPQRAHDQPFDAVTGELESTAMLSFVTDPPYPQKSQDVGNAIGRFRARHCGQLDSTMLE